VLRLACVWWRVESYIGVDVGWVQSVWSRYLQGADYLEMLKNIAPYEVDRRR